MLSKLLTAEHVLLGLAVTSKKRLFEEIGFLFERSVQLPHNMISDSLFARERMGSTGLGHGVAIPHGRIKGLKEPRLALIQLTEGIGFGAADGAPVSLLFALLVPEKAVQKHLDLLASIAELLGNEAARESLKTASDLDTIMDLVRMGAKV